MPDHMRDFEAMGLLRNPLARMRVVAGLNTAADAAKVLGCSRIHLLNIERGASGASEGLVRRMSEAYKQNPETIRDAMTEAKRDLLERQLEHLAAKS